MIKKYSLRLDDKSPAEKALIDDIDNHKKAGVSTNHYIIERILVTKKENESLSVQQIEKCFNDSFERLMKEIKKYI